MDGISTVATIAGVASAGIHLSTALYDLMVGIRDAPKAMRDVARGISDMAVVLHQLRRMLRDREELFKRRLLRSIDSALRRIRGVHGEVRSLIRRCSGAVARVLWIFRQSRVSQLLVEIEGIKSAIALMLQIMTLAVQLRDIPRKPIKSDKADGRRERSYLRHEADNLVRAARQSLLDLSIGHFQGRLTPGGSQDAVSENGELSQHDGNLMREEEDVSEPGAESTAVWLHDTIFAPLDGVPTARGLEDDELKSLLSSASRMSLTDLSYTHDATGYQESNAEESDARLQPSDALIKITESPTPTEEAAEDGSAHLSPAVNQLLSEWTNLPENDIAEAKEKDAKDKKVEPVKLKDRSGRKITIPFHKCNTWAGIEGIIKEAYLRFDKARDINGRQITRVAEGCYDLVSASGEVILPSFWEDFVEPGCEVSINFWSDDLARRVAGII